VAASGREVEDQLGRSIYGARLQPAATLYGNHLRASAPPSPADLPLLQPLFEVLTSEPITPRESWVERARPPVAASAQTFAATQEIIGIGS
jgi:hypothetical protein